METENVRNEIEIDIRGLLSAILNRLTIIILVGILTGGIAFAYSQYFVDPEYVSVTKVYILSKQDPNQKTLTTSDLTFATYLANDYRVLLTCEPVLQQVKEELNLEQPTSAIASLITVELEEDTRIMKISVTNNDPKLAKKIADKVRDVANEKTKDVMDGIEAVNPIDEANLPTAPISPNVEKYTMLGFLLGFGFSVIIVMVMFVLDDTIKTPDDIEKRLGVSVLASIPLKSVDSSSRSKKKGSYGYNPANSKNKKKKTENEDKQDDTEIEKNTEKSDIPEKAELSEKKDKEGKE